MSAKMAATILPIFRLCAVGAVCCLVTAVSPRLDVAESHLTALTHRVQELSEKLQGKTDSRERTEQTTSNLNIRLNAIFGNGCSGSWRTTFRCGTTPQCVPNILLCNGYEDCANGADEINCEEGPIRSGDVYNGGCMLDTCDNSVQVAADYADRWIFKSISTKPWFPQQEILKSDAFEPYNVTVDDIDSEFVQMTSYHQVGTATYQSMYRYPSGGSPLWESCQALSNGKILRCQGWRASMYARGRPCYLCHYVRQ